LAVAGRCERKADSRFQNQSGRVIFRAPVQTFIHDPSMSIRVLCLLTDGFEELETIAPVDLLRRAGVEVVVVSMGQVLLTGRNGIRMMADVCFEDVDVGSFDLLLLPGGPGVAKLRADGRAGDCARYFVVSGKPVAAICAAPLILMDAGLLDGKRFTAFPGVWAELGGCLDERVVEDGLLITSRGAGTSLDFAFAVVARLCGKEKARALAGEISC
jgi:4-methyl-5(b-hydroxyethyl)-thiazole monophosphate biosynthesis